MTDLEQKVLDATREWLTDRIPHSPASKALAAAVARAFPDDMETRETCVCPDKDECDECLTAAEMEALIQKWERESAAVPS